MAVAHRGGSRGSRGVVRHALIVPAGARRCVERLRSGTPASAARPSTSTVAPPLRLEQALVSEVHQRVVDHRVVVGDAHADADLHGGLRELDRRVARCSDGVGDLRRLLGVGVPQQQTELVAAEPGDEVAGSGDSLEPARDFHQHYMPSASLLQASLQRVQRRWPAISLIAPQHGRLIPGPMVDEAFEMADVIDMLLCFLTLVFSICAARLIGD